MSAKGKYIRLKYVLYYIASVVFLIWLFVDLNQNPNHLNGIEGILIILFFKGVCMNIFTKKVFDKKAQKRKSPLLLQKGLSLIEASMVLALSAIVVSGVMYYYQAASDNNKTQTTVSEVMSIVSAVNGRVIRVSRSLLSTTPPLCPITIRVIIVK